MASAQQSWQLSFCYNTSFLAEVLNTAIEKTLDLIEPEHNGKVAIIKDMAAGAVLVAAVGAFIIGSVIFWPYLLSYSYGVSWLHR